jgi:hypothetical protein
MFAEAGRCRPIFGNPALGTFYLMGMASRPPHGHHAGRLKANRYFHVHGERGELESNCSAKESAVVAFFNWPTNQRSAWAIVRNPESHDLAQQRHSQDKGFEAPQACDGSVAPFRHREFQASESHFRREKKAAREFHVIIDGSFCLRLIYLNLNLHVLVIPSGALC